MRALVDEIGDRLRGLGHEVEADDPPYPLSNPVINRFLGGIAGSRARVERPERLQRRTRGFARLGRSIAPPLLDGARAEDNSERIRVLRAPRRPGHASSARRPVRAGQWEGRGALYTLLALVATYPFAAQSESHRPAAIAVPAAPPRTGCRWESSWWAAPREEHA